MKTRHVMGIGLVGLLLSTVTLAAAPVAMETANETSVAAASPVVDEIIVTARRPDASPKPEFEMENPLDLLLETPIKVPSLGDTLLIKPEIRLNL